MLTKNEKTQFSSRLLLDLWISHTLHLVSGTSSVLHSVYLIQVSLTTHLFLHLSHHLPVLILHSHHPQLPHFFIPILNLAVS